MYEIQTVESPVTLAAFHQSEDAIAPMPPVGTWLVPEHIRLVAVGPEGPVGAILLTPCRQVGSLVTKYRLCWLFVQPQHRHRGVGRRLIQAAASMATGKGASTIQIPLSPNNEQGMSWTSSLPKVPGLGFVVSLDRCGGF